MSRAVHEWTWAQLLESVDDWLARDPSARLSDPHGESVWAEVSERLQRYARLLAEARPQYRREDLDDVVAELLLRLQDRAFVSRMRRVSVHAGYFSRLFDRALIDQERMRRREAAAWTREPPTAEVGFDDPAHEVVTVARLRRLLESLAPEDLELLRLRLADDLSLEEIARRQRQPVSTVASRIQRLLAGLREMTQT